MFSDCVRLTLRVKNNPPIMMGTKENTSCVRNNVVVPFRTVQCVYSASAPATELIPHEHTAVRQYEQSAWDPIGTLL